MSDSIAVEARFEADGTIHPLSFTWKGRHLHVASLGRRWESNGEKHFLVMTVDDQTFELVFLPAESRWELLRLPRHFRNPPRTT